MKKIFSPLIIFLTLISIDANSQGCSDAGFCTMGAMRPAQIYTKKIDFKLKSIEIGQHIGATPVTPTIYVTYMDFNFGVTDKSTFQIKVPFQAASGSFGSAAGLGDISLSFTQNIKSTETYHINGSVGFKIPSGRGDKQDSDPEKSLGRTVDLPMYYQPSLGSFDFVIGASWINSKWLFATGAQIPLVHINENDWRRTDWLPPLGNYPSETYVDRYDRATDLERGIDVMLRAERTFHFSKWDFNVGVLPIFRITEDKIRNLETDEMEAVDGTTGMALTALGSTAYNFNTTSALKFLVGIKITDRDVNPDGLTRDQVFNISYIKRF